MTAPETAAVPVRRLDPLPGPGRLGTAAPAVQDGGGRSVLEGAFGLLEAVERGGQSGLTRLAAECGLPKTTAYRLLEQLVELGAVERGHGGYRMGSRMFRLGRDWQPYPGLRSAARGPARRLARITGAVVALGVLREARTLVLDWTACETDDRLDPLLDRAVWPWCTAAGKVLAAAAPSWLPPGPVPVSWWREAAAIRERGVAFDREEVVAGACWLAVPLYGPAGPPVAALGVVTDPAHSLERLVDVVQQTGRTISARLGGR
ncbi:IclR family transcriptional regulator [Streptomyces geranii]|uniref:IclR family transcriptional regulator n=1 Tax=Streptomyces geranii TaxID=2058923 RepID=UPI001E42B375|nr:helix-turn-helix domain-containing protein [Streptomyces geranii]